MNNLAEQIYQNSLDLPDEAAFEVLDFIATLKMRLVHNQSAFRPGMVTGGHDHRLSHRNLQESQLVKVDSKAKEAAGRNDDQGLTGEDSPLFRQLQEIGFIGCRSTDEQLASTYKQRLDFSAKTGNKP